VCFYFQYFDHDVNSYPYHDVSDESYARLNAMIETMNEQYPHFVNEKREFDLLYWTDPSLPSSRHEASLFDGYESSLLLESNFIDDARSTNIGEVLDSPMTFCHLLLRLFLAHL